MYECGGLIQLTQDRIKCWSVVNTVISRHVNFLTSWERNIDFTPCSYFSKRQFLQLLKSSFHITELSFITEPAYFHKHFNWFHVACLSRLKAALQWMKYETCVLLPHGLYFPAGNDVWVIRYILVCWPDSRMYEENWHEISRSRNKNYTFCSASKSTVFWGWCTSYCFLLLIGPFCVTF
jgi:hypothetical protein